MACLILSALWLQASADPTARGFVDPPDSARPGVYWYFMDGNLSREGMTRDLESMIAAGLGHLVFLEVNVGVPRGPVDFLSEPWQDHFVHAVREAERLGIEITLGSGPGWTGSGGPWVKPEQSMQHLVASQTEVQGPGAFQGKLPVPPPHRPFFGDVPPQMRADWETFYRDVTVLAFPTPSGAERIPDVDEKALYDRAPFTSQPGVRPFFEAPADFPVAPENSVIHPRTILDLSDRLRPDGTLAWEIPAGSWTVLRFVSRNNGASTRPAPEPGLGFECDKFDQTAFDAHLERYVGVLLNKVGPRAPDRGWTMLHMDSWEMGAQNWTPRFREEFRQRRGYDPQPFYPAYLGYVVGSREQTERFLWDLRLTGQDLVLEHHAEHLKAFGRRHGFTLSIEPYDMNPTSDFDLGAVADMPMCEFWSLGFNSTFSCHLASSIGHVLGRPVIAAEAFTGAPGEDWKFYPGYLKNQGDWAFGTGINRLTYHTFAHKPDETRPGMVMGPYGVHWDRGQTWWPMVADYHRYITRCQFLLRQGRTVADILYLMPEGAPNAFQPPASAFDGTAEMPDRRGYNFDGCSPQALVKLAQVRDRQIVFPGGAAYRILVLPDFPTMTPGLLNKLEELVQAGATIVGPPPRKSPSLVDYPHCDLHVAAKAKKLWGDLSPARELTRRTHGQGQVIDPMPSSPRTVVPIITRGNWIWFPEGKPAQAADPGTVVFRRLFQLETEPTEARLELTADNSFSVTVNNTPMGEGDNFHRVYSIDLLPALKRGRNTLEVRASNGGTSPNPAGLIAALLVKSAGQPDQVIVTDALWHAARIKRPQPPSPEPSASAWQKARLLGPATMAPWQLRAMPPPPELYPHYDLIAGLLESMGVPPDFQTTGPLRYTHRSTADREIYFVANRTDQPLQTTATFRVTGSSPELWDPRTGQIRALPQFTAADRHTTIPLRFEAFESRFIVFPKTPTSTATPPPDVSPNFADKTDVSTLTGSWEVAFDPAMGAPAQARFDHLADWTTHPDPGIRHYSGIATYRQQFDLPLTLRDAVSNSLFLDLGEVRVMARVRVNGVECGVAWTAPWQVDISQAVRATDNTLEIEVANLWPNRMIGDARDPQHTYTKTTYRPYQADHPLLPSGLLGPVRLLTTTP
ncbi:MAG: hypothetical protein KJ072_04985 [Verrucomicrobia bacterium]|nr:hypothetical protein [Verrucomicrobiota bacterium]